MLVALFGLAFGLRLYHLDSSPLRGDEAFAVQVWAGDPVTTLRDWYDEEPHPLGTFLGFWAWKNAAGDSEFAMRYLPLLGNLVGVAALAALGQRLFNSYLAAGLAAALWAINPFQIWHAQDVRNYALWAALSPLAMLAFLRALDANRRRDWAFYVLVETLALYTFFLEAFFVVVQASWLIVTLGRGTGNPRTTSPDSSAARHRSRVPRAFFAWIVIGLLLIPWFIQIWLLSGSGYEGNTETSSPIRLVTWFLPTLLAGEHLAPSWSTLVQLGWLVLFGFVLLRTLPPWDRIAWLLVTWTVIPAGLLLVVGFRMAIFHPRYLIALTPALLLIMVLPLVRATDLRLRVLLIAGIALIPLAGMVTLRDHYLGKHPKTANWPALATYLDHRAQTGDLIVATNPDPALRYYYNGGAADTALSPYADPAAQLRPELNFYDAIWLIGRQPEAEQFLHDHMQLMSFHEIPGFPIMQFRAWEPDPAEIGSPANIRFGDVATLAGYTIQGPDPAVNAITVLLYWKPLRQTAIDYKVFVHLIGPPYPGSIWDQDDARPLKGFASTREWEPGVLLRDPYDLLVGKSVDLRPGEYEIQVGFYDPAANMRLEVIGEEAEVLGDSYAIFSFGWPLCE